MCEQKPIKILRLAAYQFLGGFSADRRLSSLFIAIFKDYVTAISVSFSHYPDTKNN